MGYYIQTPGHNTGKAQRICEEHQEAFIIPRPTVFAKVPDNMGLVCVIDNGLFDAAGYCYNLREFLEFSNPDDTRPKTWLLMDKKKAEKLSGYTLK